MRRRLLPPRQGRQGLTWRARKGRARGGWRLPPGLAESAIRDIIRVSRLGQASEPVVPLRRPSQSVVRMRLPIASSEPSESVVRVSRRRQSPEWNRVCLLSAAPASTCSREAHLRATRSMRARSHVRGVLEMLTWSVSRQDTRDMVCLAPVVSAPHPHGSAPHPPAGARAAVGLLPPSRPGLVAAGLIKSGAGRSSRCWSRPTPPAGPTRVAPPPAYRPACGCLCRGARPSRMPHRNGIQLDSSSAGYG